MLLNLCHTTMLGVYAYPSGTVRYQYLSLISASYFNTVFQNHNQCKSNTHSKYNTTPKIKHTHPFLQCSLKYYPQYWSITIFSHNTTQLQNSNTHNNILQTSPKYFNPQCHSQNLCIGHSMFGQYILRPG